MESLLIGTDISQSIQKVVLHTSEEMARYNADKSYVMRLTEERELTNGRTEQIYMVYSLEPLARWVLANIDKTPLIIPEELLSCMKYEDGALEKFHTYSDGQKKAFIDWINSAKTEQTKVARIAQTIVMVLNGDRFY